MSINKSFDKEYMCFPYKKLNGTDKIILPEDVLTHLNAYKIQTPYFFKLVTSIGVTKYCSPIEFSAPKNVIYMPRRMIEDLYIADGDCIQVLSVNLPQGKSVKLKNIGESDFSKLINPTCVLEKHMRTKSTLELDEVIRIKIRELDRIYELKVIEIEPEDVISLIDANLRVTFFNEKI